MTSREILRCQLGSGVQNQSEPEAQLPGAGPTSCQVYFTVQIDGIQISSEENSDPRTFENVQVFAGDNFYDPANARYKNLKYERRPEGKFLMLKKEKKCLSLLL